MGAETTNRISIVELQGRVEVAPGATADWILTQTNQELRAFYRLRTGPNSRVTLRWSDQSFLRFGPLAEVEILPPHASGAESGLHLLKGILSFFHRDEPGRIRVITRGAVAGVNGTEFVVAADSTGTTERTTLSVIDGTVQFGNERATLILTNGQQAIAEQDAPPVLTSGFIANNILQWCFYYPAVLDLGDLPLTTEEQQTLSESLAAYRAGDLLAALAHYPTGRQPGSDAERVYYAALLLAVGQVERAEAVLAKLATTEPAGRLPRLAGALRLLIAAVKDQSSPSTLSPELATEFLAASYYEQSRGLRDTSLRNALALAHQAVTNSPGFGFAWERVAELEFSFGGTGRALEALDRSLALTPRNAEALALKGFLLAGQDRTQEAIERFNDALAVDSALGNAWLGRGLCRIRRGDTAGGLEDLLVAAALEPQRALLRSYLGKAYAQERDYPRASKEFDLAKGLDHADPTAWLYSALAKEQQNRINEAVQDLEKSQELNENRSIFRSGLLLDQDMAVRSANLARIYGEAGLDDVALREASRAVVDDYGNFSAHLFLANSYEQLRSANRFDLRYETPAFSEYLVASMLGPADGRLLAQPVTQQEYTRLFERDTLGLSTDTEYLSRGAWSQYAAQYGTVGKSSYALEGSYLSDPGETPNGQLESWQLSLKAKQMLTSRDGLFFEIIDFHETSGDLAQRYDPDQAIRGLEVHEKQEPSLLAGLDHQWSDSQRTLLLVSRFNSSLQETNPHGGTLLITETFGVPTSFVPADLTQDYHNRSTVDSVELQHLIRTPHLQTVAGIRVQSSTDELANFQAFNLRNSPGYGIYFGTPGDVITNQSLQVQAFRVSPYLYEYWQIVQPLMVIGGVSYDYQELPRNTLFAPLGEGNETQHHLSPKAGMVWTPFDRGVVRAAYSQSLGGFDLDQSVRLEPTQLAGFVQAYRNLFPDSLVGSVGGAHFETGDVSAEYRFASRTYVAATGQLLRSSADHDVGAFERELSTSQGPAVQLTQSLHFEERSLDFSAHQLLGDWFSLGARYRLSDACLSQKYPGVDPALGNTSTTYRGIMHTVSLQGLVQHPSGFFAGVEATWWSQELRADLAGTPGDSFWQENLLVGYRFPRRYAEITLGVLNLSDDSYRLYPINLYPDLPRSRTFFVRLQLNF
jgi:tetratricopeptide (TPR) repeat protein